MSGSSNLKDEREVSERSISRIDGWALQFYAQLAEKQPSEQQPHAQLNVEKFDESAGEGKDR
jgi:hypothetical protein